MARAYSLKALIDLVVYGNHDAASAAAIFNKSIAFIQKQQATREYQNSLARAQQDSARRLSQTIKIASTPDRPGYAATVPMTNATVNAEKIEYREYLVSHPPETRFYAKFYANYDDFLTDTELPNQPVVTFDPPEPVNDGDWHTVKLSYTLRDRYLYQQKIFLLFGLI